MTHDVLEVSLGPVGGFIDQARRLRDLWSGSFLLSWLTGNALAAVLREQDAEALLPSVTAEQIAAERADTDPMLHAIWRRQGAGDREQDLRTGPGVGSLVNSFVVAVPQDSRYGKTAEAAIDAAWRRLADKIRAEIVEKALLQLRDAEQAEVAKHCLALWDEQTRRGAFWEVYWVQRSIPANGDEDARLANGAALAARKAWRSSGAPSDSKAGDRCHLMPQWQELSGCRRASREGAIQDAFWRAVAEQIHLYVYDREASGDDWPTLELRRHERLCAVALVKRLFPILKAEHLVEILGWVPSWHEAETGTTAARHAARALRAWPSTAYLAAVRWAERAWTRGGESSPNPCIAYAKTIRDRLPCVLRLAEASSVEAVGCLAALAKTDKKASAFLSLDGYCFHEDGLRALRGRMSGTTADAEDRDILANLKAYQTLRENLGGDEGLRVASPYYALVFMDGDKMGEKLANPKSYPWDATSGALLAFSRGAAKAVREANGIVIFAGGDDLWAAFPAEDAVRGALAVQTAFKRAFQESGLTETPTLSAGIVFADYRQPLTAVRQTAKRMLEEVAKEQNSRDSVALAVLQAATPTVTWVAKWEQADFVPVAELASLAAQFSRPDSGYARRWFHKLNQRFARFLRQDARSLVPESGNLQDGKQIVRILASEFLADYEDKLSPEKVVAAREQSARLLRVSVRIAKDVRPELSPAATEPSASGPVDSQEEGEDSGLLGSIMRWMEGRRFWLREENAKPSAKESAPKAPASDRQAQVARDD